MSNLRSLKFDNRFVRELPFDLDNSNSARQVSRAMYSIVAPTAVKAPQTLAFSRHAASLIDLTEQDCLQQEFAAIFSGNETLKGMQTYSTNYGGHQFGQWAGQLGDGRAISLGEVVNRAGDRWELQLKGAGPTPYSRRADGRAVLRSSVREFLCSEAMHHLGVPTTRALSLVATGEMVMRDMFYDGHPQLEPGAIVCRMAPSFTRFGHFELPASRGDSAMLNQLIDFTIARDFAHLSGSREHVRGDWFREICERTAVMVSHWLRVGFVHGVMNTDNMSILGLTIDYGPYGWVDNFDPGWTPNTTDAQTRRYCFGQQAPIAYWNLTRLAMALSSVFESHDALHAGLKCFENQFEKVERIHAANKLGFQQCEDEDLDLLHQLYDLMSASEIDMTIFFRQLSELDNRVVADVVKDRLILDFKDAFYDAKKVDSNMQVWTDWFARYAIRLSRDTQSAIKRAAQMQSSNPKFVLRNYLAQEVIDQASAGNFAPIQELLNILQHPYENQSGKDRFAEKRPDWARVKAGCSMLSCSS